MKNQEIRDMEGVCLEKLYEELREGDNPNTFTQIKLTRACNQYGEDMVLELLELIHSINQFNELFEGESVC